MAIDQVHNSAIDMRDGVVRAPTVRESGPANSKCAEYDHAFNASSNRDWLELIRDIAAVANSGGGQIAVRLADLGPNDTEKLKSQDVIDRLAQFTDSAFDSIQVHQHDSNPTELVFEVGAAVYPIVFVKAGCAFDEADAANRIKVTLSKN